MRAWLFAATVTVVLTGGLFLLGVAQNGTLSMPELMRADSPVPGPVFAVLAVIAVAVLLRRLRTWLTSSDDLTLEAAMDLVAPPARDTLPQHYIDQTTDTPSPDLLDEVLTTKTYRLVVVSTSSRVGAVSAADRIAEALEQGRDDTGPVPFAVSAAEWNPTRTGLSEWLHKRLVEATPRLSAAMAQRLVVENRVIPILYDLPVEHHAALALALIRGPLRVIVTTPAVLYPTTVDRSQSHRLQVAPAPAATADRHIGEHTEDDPRWDEVRAALESTPAGQVLRTPTGMDLALTRYSAAGTVPAELLDTTRFPTETAVLRHLLDQTILAAVPRQPDSPSVPDELALQWISWLAAARGHRDLTWRILNAASGWAYALIGLVMAAVAGLGVALSTTAAEGAYRFSLVTVAVVVVGGTIAAAARTRPRLISDENSEPGASALLLLGWTQLASTALLGLAGPGRFPSFLLYTIPVTGLLPLVLLWGITLFWPRQRGNPVFEAGANAAIGLIAASLVTFVLWGGAESYLLWLMLLCPFAVAATARTLVFRYVLAVFALGARSRMPWHPFDFLDKLVRQGLLVDKGANCRFRFPELQERAAAHGASDPLPTERSDTAATDAIADQAEQLTARAFERADVRAIVDSTGIAALEEEVVALVANEREAIATATAASRSRFTEAKGRYRKRVVFPAVVAFSGVTSILVPISVAVATVALLIPVLGVDYPLAKAGALGLALGAVTLFGERFARITTLGKHSSGANRLFSVLDRAPVPRQIAASVRGLRRLPHYPRLSPVGWAAVSVLLASLVVLAFSAVRAIWPGIATAWWQTALVACGVALVAGLAWWGTKSQRDRSFALRSDSPADWPAVGDSARRDAVVAYEEWQLALVDQGVLPLVRTRLSQLSEPSYDTALPPASVANLGDLTERAQFVPTETSARLERMLASMSSGAIGISGGRGVGKSTLLRMLGERSLTGPRALSLRVDAPTNYQSRDFLVHLFTRVCEEVIGPDRDTGRSRPSRRQVWWSLAVLLLGGAVVAGALLWPKPVEWVTWFVGDLRLPVIIVGGLIVVAPLVFLAVVRVRWTRAKRPPDVVQRARVHLEGLRYLETTSTARTAAVKPPAWVELSRANTRQRAAQAKTYPELVAEFRSFLGHVGLRLRGGPDGADSRIVICVDELDKIATAVDAERFINDLKTVFGVEGCFFLVAVSEDALASFDRRALAVRTTFDSAFETVIRVDRFSLDFTRRLLVQRVLRLPEPYVWLCHALSGGLPRDLNRTVRQLYDLRSTGTGDQLPDLATALVDLDLRTVVRGQLTRVSGRVDPGTGALVQWLSRGLSVERTSAALTAHANAVPLPDPANPHHDDLLHLAQQTSVYLHYTATLLRAFTEDLPSVTAALRDTDAAAIADLADCRTHLSTDPALALEHLNTSRAALVSP
ncbi:hypothetical protein JOD54_004658 [Actinokineospora baliensis]|uniref:hypothetical protein n=1 Tax=Actinokineospora baliensis TaxID=547056 RepID=UPI0019566967|nr:hypothetical protein [Actinokineospora baliensis]MBM7774454.1 hypothetical protein [Actinokineospora baliensis]